MGTLSNISSSQVMKAFEKLGWELDRRRGSHQVLAKAGARSLVIPNRVEMRKGTLRNLIRDAGLTVDEFLELL